LSCDKEIVQFLFLKDDKMDEVKSSRTNDVTLFSNGIGHFRRVHQVAAGKEETISIPFKREHIGDVAGSLQVFGPVRLNAPPSFTPANANATALKINQNEALKSLLKSLSGSEVNISQNNGFVGDYKLLGLDTVVEVEDEVGVEKHFVVVMNTSGVSQIPLSQVTNIIFTEESVKTEIEKALKNNFQQIKPDSTLMEVSLSSLTDKDVEATLQYTIPVAAWKMRYAIREDNGRFSLEGAAIIDNNTDEDWGDFKVSVVTGNPISFSTDIANIVVPERKHVQIVDGSVLENFTPEIGRSVVACSMGGGAKSLNRSLGPKMSTANYAQFGLESTLESTMDSYEAPFAETPGVDSKEVGDFCVFTSKTPITILARKSAIVPMFTVPLAKAGIVLLYKESNNARRPYRAVKFKNETEYSLGKGKTTIYNEGIFSGECVLDATKPNENRMLPHCLENGVKIVKETTGNSVSKSSLSVSDGVVVEETVHTVETVYSITNNKDEAFNLAIEHSNVLNYYTSVETQFSGVEIKEQEKLSDSQGYRAYIELSPKQSVELKVVESSVVSNKVTLSDNFSWFKNQIIEVANPFINDDNVKACISIQERIDENHAELLEVQRNQKDLKEQSERVRKNIAAVQNVGNNTTIASWVQDLEVSEKEIRLIETKTIADLNTRAKILKSEMNRAVKKISSTWKIA
jgi:hypothetical protein